jgi:hypothetical protein
MGVAEGKGTDAFALCQQSRTIASLRPNSQGFFNSGFQ